MSLLAELKKKLNAVYDRIDSLKAESDALDDEAYDLDVACRALEEDELYATKDLDEPLEPAEALLDPQPEAASPEFASEQGEAHDETWTPPPGYTYIPTQAVRCRCDYLVTDTIGNYFCCNQRNDERTSVVTDQDRVEPQIPEGFTPWSGGECPVPGQSVEYLCAADDVPVKTDRPEDWTWRHEGIPSRARIIAYRIIQPSAEAERIEDVSQATDPDRVDRVEQADVLLENQPGVSSQASSGEAADEAAIERGALAARCGLSLDDCPENEPRPHEWASGWAMENPVHKLHDSYAEGRASYVAGLTLDDVPSKYHPRSIGAGHWQDGWLAARGPNVYPDDARRVDALAQAQVAMTDVAHEEAEPSIDAERTSESQSTDGIDRVEPAAFAPLNEDEGLMWSNGFEADAKAKACADKLDIREPDEREMERRKIKHFSLFGKKELA